MRTPFVTRAGLAARLLPVLALLALLAGWAAPLAAQGTGRITGVVTGTDGAPIPNAQVAVVGTQMGARTGNDGRYTVTGVPAGSYQVRAGVIGYASSTLSVTVGAAQTVTADFRLATSLLQLDTLVAVGYTNQRRTTVSDAVAEVTAEQIQDRIVATVDEALRGRVAGVAIQSTGEPGRGSQIAVRGQAFTTGSAPLYVIDGVYTRQNPGLNPRDIESIQVLKDASAAAQYGAQSANGVIVITTKRGRSGAPRISVNSYYGVSSTPERIDFVDADRWAEINMAARANSTTTADDAPGSAYDTPYNTDWQDALFRTGHVQEHNFSVSGGSNESSYLIGAGYFDQEGTIINTGFERYSFRVNSELRGSRWRVGESAALSRFNRDNIVGFPLVDAVRLQPGIPVYDPNNASGYGYGQGNGPLASFGTNPVGAFERELNRDVSNRVLGSIFGELDLFAGLRYRINLGVDYQDLNWNQFVAQTQIRQNTVPTFNEGVDQRITTTALQWEHLLSFERLFGQHSISAVAGISEQSQDVELLRASRRGFPDEELTEIDNGTDTYQNSGNSIPSALRGYLVRANYAFADRYLLTGTVRRDESSRFGPNNHTADFFSGSAGWVLSEESFYGGLGWVSRNLPYAKLRVSYGELGNQDISDFAYDAAITAGQSYLLAGGIVAGATQTGLANPNLRWQSQKQFNVGADLGMLDRSLNVTLDYYRTRSTDLLVQAPIPWSLGADGIPYVNAGVIENRGFELGAEWNVERGDLSLNLAGNLTTIDNEVKSLGDFGQPIYSGSFGVARTAVGGSIGEFYVLQTDGLFQSEEEIDAYTNTAGVQIQPNARPGDIRYVDRNDDGVINNDDRYVAGSPIPDLEGGFSMSATYRRFNLGLALRGSHGAEVFNVVKYWTDRMDENANYRSGLDPWSEDNRDARDPRPVFGAEGADNARANTDRWIEDGSFLRVQNIVLGYVLPPSLTSRFGIAGEGSRVYLNVQNAWTITGFSNWDPEINTGDVIARGIDDGRVYPNPRTFTLGIDLNL